MVFILMEEKSCFESELLWMLHFVCCLVLVYLRTMSLLKYINKIFNNSNTWCIMKLELSLRCFHALLSVYAPFMLVQVCPNFFLPLSDPTVWFPSTPAWSYVSGRMSVGSYISKGRSFPVLAVL